jgi:predicted ferric reductase
MEVVPQSRVGRWALGLLLVVALYPMYWSVFMLIPDSWRAVNIGVAVLIVLIAFTSLVLAGVAIFREKDRSLLLIVFATLTLLLVLSFAIGEALSSH